MIHLNYYCYVFHAPETIIMIFIPALLAVFACASANHDVEGCDMHYLCYKLDDTRMEIENSTVHMQQVESQVDELDKKADSLYFHERLHATLLGIDKTKYDISPVYKDRIYVVSKMLARFIIKDANDACKTQGGYLLEIDDNEEREFTYNLSVKIGGAPHFAAGGNDIVNEKTWVQYNSGKPLPTDLEWVPGRPNNAGGNEDCLAFWMERRGLNDIPCNTNNIKYICEVPLCAQ
ncbi:lectin C-type domain protein [Elysia marginata]|uniref:Lectin C-type domain protein n=1 Tax=Elysia marginata TaxID=1093978 RepID=A0AAV4ENF0_9GAST|nr:lectin C-type domain protein [Elysia marginata]